MRVRETLRYGSDYKTGCQWITWTLPGADASQVTFFGEVQQITMYGTIRETDPTEKQTAVSLGGGIASTAEYRYMYEHKKDLAGHVWAVAIHDPTCKITVTGDGRPTSQPWVLDSLHEASGNSMARGKRLWNEEMKPRVGPYDKFDLHYGQARYLLVPLSAGLTLAGNRPDLDAASLLKQRDVNGVHQVRVERIKVEARDSLLSEYVPAPAITFDKPFRPLCPGREKVPRLPRIESELQALFNDAGERQAIEEENEEIQLSGPTNRVSSIYGVRSLDRPPNEDLQSNSSQVYEEWAAGPHTPIPLSTAATCSSPIPSPPPAPKARNRFGVGLGAGIANIRRQIHQNTVSAHSRRRLAEPTVDERGSPIERIHRPIYTTGEPQLRLDTPGRVSISHDPPKQAHPLTILPVSSRRIGRSRDSPVHFLGFQSHENVGSSLFLSFCFLVSFLAFTLWRGGSSPPFLSPFPNPHSPVLVLVFQVRFWA